MNDEDPVVLSPNNDALTVEQRPPQLLHRTRRYVPNPTVQYPKTEEQIYSYVYDMYIHVYKTNDRKWKKFMSSGILYLISLGIFYLQLLSLVLLPSLSWTKGTKQVLSVFSVIRTFHLQPLLNSILMWIHKSDGETFIENDPDYAMLPFFRENVEFSIFLNHYFPFLVSITATIALFIIFFVTFRYKSRRQGLFGWLYHLLAQILPALYLPTLSGYLSTITCYNNFMSAEFEILPDSCFTSFPNLLQIPISIILFIPFISISLFILCTTFEWRMDIGNISARPHSRYDMAMYTFATILIVITSLFQFLPVIPLLIDFVAILFLVVLHIYFLVYYKTMMNIMITSCLFTTLFGCMIALLLAIFMVFFNLPYFYTQFPGMALLGCAFLSLGLGAIITVLRLHVIKLLIIDPRRLLVMHTLSPNDVVVPRGEYEVEMANRTIEWVSGFHHSFTLDTEHRGQTEDQVRLQMREMQSIDRVDEMYKNAIDHVHNHSVYVFLSYATFLIHIARNRGRAIHILELIEQYFSPGWLDFRCHYYVRRKFWIDEFLPATEAQNNNLVAQGPSNDEQNNAALVSNNVA